MGIIRGLRRLFALAVIGLGLSFLGIMGFALLNPAPAPETLRKTDVIVVLGAGMDPDGRLHRSTQLRVKAGVALWLAGRAPIMHFTGGKAAPNGPSAGAGMAALAQKLSVPHDAISFEDRSLSTLQNALFSQPMLRDATSLRLVTEGFHLPRSWLSFKWAAWHAGQPVPSIYLSHSERLRQSSPKARRPQLTMVTRETGALWFNGLRLLAFEVGMLFGVAEETRTPWLD